MLFIYGLSRIFGGYGGLCVLWLVRVFACSNTSTPIPTPYPLILSIKLSHTDMCFRLVSECSMAAAACCMSQSAQCVCGGECLLNYWLTCGACEGVISLLFVCYGGRPPARPPSVAGCDFEHVCMRVWQCTIICETQYKPKCQ